VLQALIFDVDGTLADTERAHRAAFNHAFRTLGLGWHWDETLYTGLLAVSGGKERIAHYWRSRAGLPPATDPEALQACIDRIHALKTAAYEEAVAQGAVRLRPGVLALIEAAAAAGLTLAIATTTSPPNIAALLRRAIGPDWRLRFAAIGDGASAPRKKPDPLVYRQVLATLKLPARACLAFEDSANGLHAARAAGIATLVTPTAFTRHHDFGGALRVLPDLAGLDLATLRAWHARAADAHSSTLEESPPCRRTTA